MIKKSEYLVVWATINTRSFSFALTFTIKNRRMMRVLRSALSGAALTANVIQYGSGVN
ncbi:hypothetical protein ACI1P2_26290 [Paenibacillus sp. p-8]